jgi:HAD superfamily hydrolase (TIGR01549 family)
MPRLTDIRWLFFDLGSTLINEDKASLDRVEQIARALAERGVEVAAEAVMRALEEASAEFAPSRVRRAVEKFAKSPEDCAFVVNKIRYRHELEEPYPEAVETLAALARRFMIGVIANQSAGAKARLRSWGLGRYVSLCLSSAEAGLEKPDPMIFELAREFARCTAGEAVMIGDRLDNDIRPAKALGWKTVRVLRGLGRFQSPRDAAEEPDLTVNTVLELPAVLGAGSAAPPRMEECKRAG